MAAEPHYRLAERCDGGALHACRRRGGGLADDGVLGGELRPGLVRHWVTGTAAPCVGLFKPVRVDEPLDLGAPPTDHADSLSLWWRHERLHRQVMRDPARLQPLFATERDAARGALARTTARNRPQPSQRAIACSPIGRRASRPRRGPIPVPVRCAAHRRVRDERVGVPRSVIPRIRRMKMLQSRVSAALAREVHCACSVPEARPNDRRHLR